MKYACIHQHRGAFPLGLMCRVLDVARSGYYAWCGRPLSARARATLPLLGQIRAVHAASHGTYGSPRIHAELRATGQRVGRHRVARLMRAALLTAKHQRGDLVEAIQAGADDFVRKPFDHTELQARLWAGQRIVHIQAELARTREVLRAQAMRDPLTGLWNRRAILDALDRELSRARRGGLAVAVALLDLDHFKRVNDTYGHAAGDSLLEAAAARIAGTVRPYDTVGRYGGEEFLVILPGCDPGAAQRTMERVQTRIAATPVVTAGGELSISCSVGVACASLDAGGAPELLARAQQQLLQRADEALYVAKRNGRNRVEVS